MSWSSFAFDFLMLGCVFAPLEWLWPLRDRATSLDRYRTDIFHALIGGAIIRGGLIAVLAAAMAALGTSELGTRLPLAVQFLCVLVLSDFAYWIAHRLSHAVPFLWRLHRIHHSSEHLDWLAAFRVHPLDQIINSTIIALPAAIVGFSPLSIILYAAVYRWHAIWLHSNVRLRSLPGLAWLIATPAFHHWHHADEAHAFDRNFGGQLAIWDRLFGTAFLSSGNSAPSRYGVSDPPRESFLAHLIAPFARSSQTTHLAVSGGVVSPTIDLN